MVLNNFIKSVICKFCLITIICPNPFMCTRLHRISRPLFVGGLLAYFNPVGMNVPEKKQAYFYASGLVLNMLCTALMHHYIQMELEHCGMKIRIACCSTIYKKVTTKKQLPIFFASRQYTYTIFTYIIHTF